MRYERLSAKKVNAVGKKRKMDGIERKGQHIGRTKENIALKNGVQAVVRCLCPSKPIVLPERTGEYEHTEGDTSLKCVA